MKQSSLRRKAKTGEPETVSQVRGDSSGRDNAGPRSPTRTLRILELVAESNGMLTLAKLSERLAIPKTSSFSMLRPLVAQNYLSYVDNKYWLGPATFRFTIMASRSSFLSSVHPLVEELSVRLGETVSFSMLDVSERELEYMDVVQSTRAIRYVVNVGDKRPLYCTSGGVMLLAWQSPQWIDNYLDTTELTRITSSTVSNKEILRERLQRARGTGFVVSVGEFSEDVFGFAAPVFSHPDRVVGALVIGAPAARALPKKEEYVNSLTEIAARMSYMFQDRN